MKKMNFMNIGILLLIVVASFFVKENTSIILESIKLIISSPLFFSIVTIIVVAIKIMNRTMYGELKLSKLLDVENFKDSISEIISLVIEPSTLICSLSILKGLTLDYFYEETYFSKFNDSERFFIFIATMYFFIYAVINLKNEFRQIVIKTENIQ